MHPFPAIPRIIDPEPYGREMDKEPSTFCHHCWSECRIQVTGECGMGTVDLLRNRAEEYLEKARAVSDRQRARLLLLQAHNHLKHAEETEAQQLSARR
jgi:hypothetical protein